MDFDRADALNGAIRTISIRHRARWAAKLSTLGLHPGQETVLLLLDSDGELTQKQLAHGCGCEPPSITAMVTKLEAMGLVARHPSDTDARSMLVTLTAKGKQTIAPLKARWRELADETISYLPARSVDTVIQALTGLADHLGTHD